MKGHAMDIPDECSLIAAARAGDESAFGRLASRHRLELELFCLLMLGCPDRARPCARQSCAAGGSWIAPRRQRPRGSGSTGWPPTSASRISTGPMSLAAGDRLTV